MEKNSRDSPDGEKKQNCTRCGELRRRGNVAQIARVQIAQEEGECVQDTFIQRLTEDRGLNPKNQSKVKKLLSLHTERLLQTSVGSNPNESLSKYDSDFFDYISKELGNLSEVTIESFEELENQRNSLRPPEQRLRKSELKINAWHQKHLLQKALRLADQSPGMSWMYSFYQCDPRYQIMKFFDEVAREGGKVEMDERMLTSPLQSLLCKATVFSVWRPTSDEAIKNMMLGIAVGKGLDIKGKSAKSGNISSYVPFVQIFEEKHKEECKVYMEDGKKISVFYSSIEGRREAQGKLLDIAAEMDDDNLFDLGYDDSYSHSTSPVFGIDIPEKLFWEAYVMRQDCSRTAGTEWDIKRGSIPAFMEMNLHSIRRKPEPGEPRAVVFQKCDSNPLEPRMLLMAYDENGGVKPVVSDFDCFLLGSRGVRYRRPIPPQQVQLVKWSVKNIGQVLDERAKSKSKAGWTETWIENIMKADSYHPETPKFGNGDPKSYEIISVAVSRLQSTGCVRHGAECFNWYFPQEIDDVFLVISDTLPGNVKWKKVNASELQDLLITKIEEGFTFPINPKWVLCDPGWRRVYDKLLASQMPNVQDSINCWLPPETGLREEIEAISTLHPGGFEGVRTTRTRRSLMINAMQKRLRRSEFDN